MRDFGSDRRGKPADNLTRINGLGSTVFWLAWSSVGPSLGVIYLAFLLQQIPGQQRSYCIRRWHISERTHYDAATDFGVNYAGLYEIRGCVNYVIAGDLDGLYHRLSFHFSILLPTKWGGWFRTSVN